MQNTMNNSRKKHNNKNSNNSGCFSSILGKLICTGNLPTHPLPPHEILEKKPISRNDHVSNNNGSGSSTRARAVVVTSRVHAQAEAQVEAQPGIVARLMGLDSMPNNESLFRSKSLNSLHFLPDFDPTRAAFHRRARTSSASFHEQGQGQSFLVRIEESSESNTGEKMKENDQVNRVESKQKIKENREKAALLKNNECRRSTIRKNGESKKKYQERYYHRGNSSSKVCSKNTPKNTNVGKNVGSNNGKNSREKCRNVKVGSIVSSKKKVDRKQELYNVEVQSDVSSRSPVSVLDHRHEFDSPSRSEEANAKQRTSKSGRRSSRKIKLFDEMPSQVDIHHSKPNKTDDSSSNKIATKHELVKEDTEVTEYFAELSGQICTFAEEQLCKDLARDVRKFKLFKGHFMEELCQEFGEEMLNFLLNELTDELV